MSDGARTSGGAKGTKLLASKRTAKPRAIAGGTVQLEEIRGGSRGSALRSTDRQLPRPVELPPLQLPTFPVIPGNAPRAQFNPAIPSPLAAAIEAAPEGSLLIIPAGVYPESVKIRKRLYLRGEGDVTIASDTHADSIEVSDETGQTVVVFERIKFAMAESQAFSAAMLTSGTAAFKDCKFHSVHTVSVQLKTDATALFINCEIASSEASALTALTAKLSCDNVSFATQAQVHTVLIQGASTARFKDCKLRQCGKTAYYFDGTCQFSIENALINYPIDHKYPSEHAAYRNCTFQGANFRVTGTGTPSFYDCQFQKVSLECSGLSGIRLVNTKFTDAQEQPSLLVLDDSTVYANNCEISNSKAAAAIAVYKQGDLKLTECNLLDLCGAAIVGLGNSVALAIEGCGFGNVANSAIVAYDGPSVTVQESLFDRVGGVGLLLRNAGRVEIARSKFVNCALSGVEIDTCTGAAVDHCIFENNQQYGLVSIGSSVTVNESDFLGNKLAGVEARGGNPVITKSIALDNGAGGFVFRGGAEGEVTGGGAGTNEQFGIAADENSSVVVREVQLLENNGVGAYVTGGAQLTVENAIVERQPGPGYSVEGDGTRLTVIGGKASLNLVGLQSGSRGTLVVDSGKFERNSINLEASDGSSVTARGATFGESEDGIGAFVTDGATATFDGCTFSGEARAGLAVDGLVNVVNSTITDCQICGIFWYGQGDGEVRGNQIVANGPCGVQVMSGRAAINDNTISDHATFGIHVQPGAVVDSSGNKYSGNSTADLNRE
jgi:uncharacterized protein YjbI with pentapeptide repeats